MENEQETYVEAEEEFDVVQSFNKNFEAKGGRIFDD